MANNSQFVVPKYKFWTGATTDSPILFPIADNDAEMRSTARFCRRVRAGAPMRVPAIDRPLHKGRPATALETVDHLAKVLTSARRDRDLSLVPIVGVGAKAGAALAAQLLLLHPSLMSACVLMRPTSPALHGEPQTLSGLAVLLGRASREEAAGTIGWEVLQALKKAGADVICERVPLRNALGLREAAMTRVFVSALFGS